MTILVTGATGQLGAPTLAALTAAGQQARGSSSTGRNGLASADLFTGEGLDEALRGIDTIVHCAQTGTKKDLRLARNLTAAAQRAGIRHLVLISIVGIEDIPMPYYDQRVEIEKIVRASGVPFTLQRATQFHTLIDQLFSAQRYLPVVIAPAARFQTIAVPEVAERLASLAAGEPHGAGRRHRRPRAARHRRAVPAVARSPRRPAPVAADTRAVRQGIQGARRRCQPGARGAVRPGDFRAVCAGEVLSAATRRRPPRFRPPGARRPGRPTRCRGPRRCARP